MNKPRTSGILPAWKHLRLVLFFQMALSALVLLAACGGGAGTTGGATLTTGTTTTPAATATQAGNTQTVMITTDSSGSFAFSPVRLTIKAGTTVTWKNTTTVSHTVTSDDGKSFRFWYCQSNSCGWNVQLYLYYSWHVCLSLRNSSVYEGDGNCTVARVFPNCFTLSPHL